MSAQGIDPFYRVVKAPLVTEKAVLLLEKLGKVTLIVDRKANKKLIKDVIEKKFGVKVKKVNTMITPKGEKKAIITFASKEDAMKVATALGII